MAAVEEDFPALPQPQARLTEDGLRALSSSVTIKPDDDAESVATSVATSVGAGSYRKNECAVCWTKCSTRAGHPPVLTCPRCTACSRIHERCAPSRLCPQCEGHLEELVCTDRAELLAIDTFNPPANMQSSMRAERENAGLVDPSTALFAVDTNKHKPCRIDTSGMQTSSQLHTSQVRLSAEPTKKPVDAKPDDDVNNRATVKLPRPAAMAAIAEDPPA